MQKQINKLIAAGTIVLALAGAGSSLGQTPPAAPSPPFMLTVPAFPDGGLFPVQYSQIVDGKGTGKGTSPAIMWSNAPAGTQSFVLHMHDLDAARNKTSEDQLHWMVWPLPANVASLAAGQPEGPKLPNGSWQISATGQVYRGPGGAMHHYAIELYALDNVPQVDPTADVFETRGKVMTAIQGHILGKAVYWAQFRN